MRSTTSPRRATSRFPSRCPSTPETPPASGSCVCSTRCTKRASRRRACIRPAAPKCTARSRRLRRRRRRPSTRARPTVSRRSMATGSRSTTARVTGCMCRTASSSTTNPRAAARTLSPARSPSASPRSRRARPRTCILETSTPSATGASRATTLKPCGACCSRTSRMTTWSPRAKPGRSRTSSSKRSHTRPSTGRSTWWSIRGFSVPRKWTSFSEIRQRPRPNSAGGRRSTSRRWSG